GQSRLSRGDRALRAPHGARRRSQHVVQPARRADRRDRQGRDPRHGGVGYPASGVERASVVQAVLAHDPEKWAPVFGQDHAQRKNHKMSILVTGGAGYIGSHMVHALVDAGERVVVLDNLTTGFDWAVPKQVTLVRGDTGDQAAVAKL